MYGGYAIGLDRGGKRVIINETPASRDKSSRLPGTCLGEWQRYLIQQNEVQADAEHETSGARIARMFSVFTSGDAVVKCVRPRAWTNVSKASDASRKTRSREGSSS